LQGQYEMRLRMNIGRKLFVLVAALVASPILSQPAEAPTLTALTAIENGQWLLKASNAAENRSICVSDARVLLQVEHARSLCSRFVIANEPKATTVHYTCPGVGHGRTTLRVETPRLVQIDSQGIADKEPFAVHFEGRRVGACSVSNGALSR
jgi:hypothetical protein